jgi:hypothetical protein
VSSKNFGDYYLRAVHEVHQATLDWEKAAYVNFVYKGEYDSDSSIAATTER